MDQETLEQLHQRQKQEEAALQVRLQSKKANATKKNRRAITEECARLEWELRDRHATELDALTGDLDGDDGDDGDNGEDGNKNIITTNHDDNASLQVQSHSALALAASTTTESTAKVPSASAGDCQDSRDAENEANHASGGARRKRNRQKERLARRAAERAALSEAAAAEAAGEDDRRAQELAALRKELAARGLVEHDIRPDGHCLFAAVADQLMQRGLALAPSAPNGTVGAGEDVASKPAAEPAYKTVRRMAAAYMTAHAADFAPFLEEPLDDHVAKIRDTAEWGGQPELLALARSYGVEIAVVQEGRTELVTPGGDEVTVQPLPKLWLAYYRHGYGLGEHYNSLRSSGDGAGKEPGHEQEGEQK